MDRNSLIQKSSCFLIFSFNYFSNSQTENNKKKYTKVLSSQTSARSDQILIGFRVFQACDLLDLDYSFKVQVLIWCSIFQFYTLGYWNTFQKFSSGSFPLLLQKIHVLQERTIPGFSFGRSPIPANTPIIQDTFFYHQATTPGLILKSQCYSGKT